MCGRYSLEASPEEMAEAFPWLEDPAVGQPRYNIAPTQPVPVITASRRERLQSFRWGLVPWWADDLKIGNRCINARAESLDKKRAFREAFRERRCLMPASGFYEWQKDSASGRKVPYYLRRSDRRPVAFAGLWERWKSRSGERVYSCAIVTAPPNRLVRPLHDRMPAILSPQDYDRWLDPEATPEELSALLGPYDADAMECYPVSSLVNRPENESAECIAPAVA